LHPVAAIIDRLEGPTVSRRLALLVLCLVSLPLVLARPVGAEGAALPAVLDRSVSASPIWATEDPSAVMAVVVAAYGPTTLDLYRARGLRVGDTSPKARRALAEVTAAVRAGQAPVRQAIVASGARLIDTYEAAYNGFLVVASRRQVEQIGRSRAVRLVYRAPEHVPALSDAVPLVGAEKVLTELGFSGAGVRIAIIDTGIDYFHRSLGGNGKAKDFTDDDPDIAEPGTFPTLKVVGGWDFAGTNYAANAPANRPDLLEPKPDDDPRDQVGHGSHVSGIAAGEKGVTAVYHGAAPDAELIALKVFGGLQGGATNLANSGLEWAVKANLGERVSGFCKTDPSGLCRVDVINMSLGAPFSAKLPESEEFVRRATEAGIVVIAASGNSGDVAYVTGSPGGAPYAISVANTVPSGERSDKIEATYEGQSHDVEAVEATNTLSKPMEGERDIRADLADLGRGCTGDTPKNPVTNKIALVDALGCPFQMKVQYAKDQGADGAIIYAPDENPLHMAGTGTPVAIPAFSIRKSSADTFIKLLAAGTRVEIRLSAQFKDAFPLDYRVDTANSSSSRGPSRGGALKPDLAAPGTNIFAPAMGSGREGQANTGTSMSSPLVAGGAALLIERARKQGMAPAERPLGTGGTVGPLDIAALLVNYAGAPVWIGDNVNGRPAPLTVGGVGRMQLEPAARGTTIVRAGTIASVNFGFRALAQDLDDLQTISIRNLAASARRYRLAVRFPSADDANAGVTYKLTPSEVTVAAGGTNTADIEIAVDVARLKAYHVYGGQRLLNGASGAVTEAEIDAIVDVTELGPDGQPLAGGDVIHIPVYILPRAATDLGLEATPIMVGKADGRGVANLINPGKGAGPAELFTLLEADEIEDNIDPRLNLDYFGARVGVAATGGARTVEIALHTSGARAIPQEAQPQLWLDTDRDGRLNWLVYTADLGLTLSGAFNGQMAVIMRDVTSDTPLTLGRQVVIAGFADVDIHSRSIVLRIDAARLGYAAAAPIAFDAVAVIVPSIDDVRGDESRMRAYDAIPDDGWTDIGLGRGRVTFDDGAPSFRLDRWSVTVGAQSQGQVAVTMPSTDPAVAAQMLLALYPMNAPGEGDAQISEIYAGSVPPTRVPTNTPRPATPTPRATNTPVPTGTVHIFMPALSDSATY
jgi:minor extracellular serine protease Vpr